MKIKKVLILTVIFIIGCFSFPSATHLFAANVKNTTLWDDFGGNKGNLGYKNGDEYTYKTLNFPSVKGRKLKYLGSFIDTTNSRWVFCIEPGAHFDNNSSYNFNVGTTIPSLGNGWKITNSKAIELGKIMSCWYTKKQLQDNQKLDENKALQMQSAYQIAAQALVWELVTGERTQIAASKILKNGNYAPSVDIGNSLYKELMKRGATKTAYQSILRCAARFENGGKNGVPIWAKSTKSQAPLYEMVYDASKKQYYLIAKNKATIETEQYFKYFTFKVNDKLIGCANNSAAVDGITCRYDGVNLKFTTNRVIDKTNPVRIEFIYSYKDDKKSALFNQPTYYYSGEDSKGEKLQKMMSGSHYLNYFIKMYSTVNKYQLKINKVDENNNVIKSNKTTFNLYKGKCKGNAKKNPIVLQTTAGVVIYDKLTDYGDYCIEEKTAPSGYVKSADVDIYVAATNKAGTTSYATKDIKNTKNTLSMIKRTIKDGVAVDLDGDYCVVKTCSNKGGIENGPEFSITKDGKKVCVTNVNAGVEDGKYIYNSLSETCPENTTSRIRTCKGKFDIRGVPEGEYTVTETKASCEFDLPDSPLTQPVTVENGKNPLPVSMENGASGTVFHKKNQNGILLDGGKYALQRKESGVYKDILLRKTNGMEYVYSSELTEETGSYILETIGGLINVTQLPAGNYRFVEKEAPAGYTAIKDKDSTATFTVSDKDAKSDSYKDITLVNRKTSAEGSSDSAELIVTIITGRRVINYVLIITSLAALLIILILLRRKYKK